MITDNRKISILWRNIDSSYAHANRANLVEEPRVIGSSITAVNAIISNAEEQKVIMKDIMGLSPESQDWDKALSNYWNGFREEVNVGGKILDIGFLYDIEDPSRIKYIDSINSNLKGEAKLTTDEDLKNYIEDRLNKVSETFTKAINSLSKVGSNQDKHRIQNNAYKIKWESISMIEGERYKVGRPSNPLDYMIYRYCLNYKDVANEFALSSKSPNIRLYLYSDEDGKRDKAIRHNANKSRYEKYLELIKNIERVEDVLYALGKGSNMPKDDMDKCMLLDEESKTKTELFMTIANDPNLKLKGEIEKYIVFGILNRYPGSQTVVDATDHSKILGSTLEESITWFSNPANKALVSEYRQKYKTLPKN